MSFRSLSSRTWSRGLVKLLGVYSGICIASPAVAAEAIGSATEINRSVTGAVSGKLYPMSVGDPVKRDEWVRTDSSGEARLIFVDSTNVVIFSSSSIRMNQFSAHSIVMTASNGTYAFNTGNAPSGAYHIDTPAGTLIPHSRFRFVVQGGSIRLDVQEGDVTFCPRGKSKASCVDATPSHPVIAQAGAPAQNQGGPPPPAPPAYQQAPPIYQQVPPVYREPINYGGPSGVPSECNARSALDLRYGCPTQTRGWRNPYGKRAGPGYGSGPTGYRVYDPHALYRPAGSSYRPGGFGRHIGFY